MRIGAATSCDSAHEDAGGGLIISEGTIISDEAKGMKYAPGRKSHFSTNEAEN